MQELKTMRAVFIALILAISPISNAVAEDAYPNLLGAWKAVSGVGHTGGGDAFRFDNGSSTEFEVLKQDGPIISGIYRWSHPLDVDTMHDGRNVTNTAEETFIGVIDWDNTTIVFVDHPDTTHWTGRLVDTQTIEVIFAESGPNAMVARILFVR